ncbi:MAG: LpqB family beta-propeller domain-containing protein [Sporichthyaceae bacterium]
MRRPAIALAFVLAVSGCAEIPSAGRVGVVGDAPAAEQPRGQLVRVFAEGPRDGDGMYSIVSGFLEASSTVEDGLRTARKYLTGPASARWRVGAGVTVYDHTKLRISARDGSHLEVSAPTEGVVDSQGVYRAAEPGRQVSSTFGLVRDGGNWRIDTLPDGLLISRQDFEREYASQDLHFPAGGDHSSVLVPDPVHLRRLPGLPTELLVALLRGPSRWLAPAVGTAVPKGAALAAPVEVTSGLATVALTPESVPTDGVERDTLLAQIVMTLTDVSGVTAVEVRAGDEPVTLGGRGGARMTRSDLLLYQPVDLGGPSRSAYYLRDGVSYKVGPPGEQGPFEPATKLAEIAAAPDGKLLAGISEDRTLLWTATSDAPARLTERLKGADLRSASFDQDGNLWVLDGAAEARVLRRIAPDGALAEVEVSGFVSRQVDRLRVSADGVRLAMVLDTVEGNQLYLALITGSGPRLEVGSLRRLGYPLVEPRDVAWADPDRLAVLAAQRDAAVQPFAVALSGTVSDLAPSLADINGLTASAGQPLLATTTKKVVWRLRAGGGWFRVGNGSVVAYPG